MLGALGEVFRAHGYEGASLTLITQATGLGKGSLYNFFPDGKEQMAAEVLAHAGVAVDLFDAMPSVGRKFLLAGRGGLNLTLQLTKNRFRHPPRLTDIFRMFAHVNLELARKINGRAGRLLLILRCRRSQVFRSQPWHPGGPLRKKLRHPEMIKK